MAGNRTQKSRGFTLAEMLVALALMALLMVAATAAIDAAHQSYVYNSEKTDMVTRVRGVLDRLTQDVRRAQSVDVPDGRTVVVTFGSEETHTYEWDGRNGGEITFTVEGATTRTATLCRYVKTFEASYAEPTCVVHLVLEGEQAGAEATVSATPRKTFF